MRDPPRESSTRMPVARSGVHVQASAVRAREAYVQATHGGLAAVQRLRSMATTELRALLVDPDARGWVDYELFVEVVGLVDRCFGRGDLRLAWDAGRFAASHDVGLVRSLFVRSVSPSTMMSLAASVWSRHYDAGKLVVKPQGRTGLSIEIAEFPATHRAHCLSVGGWLLGTLEQGPRKESRVEERGCRALGQPSCSFDLTWSE
ncbi:MAG: hypothetical protein JNL79_34175 [Myxococcales bacterium]|nr:hypothetical protein [Myxococcales bacterium]